MTKFSLIATGLTCGALAAAAEVSLPLSGKVAETMEGGRYTYLNVADGTNRVWVACLHVEARVGETVQVLGGNLMKDFKSPTLNRTFDEIVFASQVQVGTNTASTGRGMPAGHPPIGGKSGGAPHGDLSGAVGGHGAALHGEVIEAMDVGPYTYVQYKIGGKTEWAAASKFKVAKGDKIQLDEGTVMKNFESPTLGRKFEEIRFVDSIQVEGAPRQGLPPGHP